VNTTTKLFYKKIQTYYSHYVTLLWSQLPPPATIQQVNIW